MFVPSDLNAFYWCEIEIKKKLTGERNVPLLKYLPTSTPQCNFYRFSNITHVTHPQTCGASVLDLC